MGVEIYIDVITKDSAVGSEYTAGSSPLVRILQWSSTSEMDRSGRFSFDLAPDSDNRTLIQRKRKVRAYAFINGAFVEIGSGIIDSIETMIDDGKTIVRVSGNDMLKELTYRTVGNLELTDSLFGITHSAALTAIEAYAPSGWTLTPSATPNNDFVYHKYTGDTVLAALNYLATATQTHFCLTGFRTLAYKETATDSGIIATERATGDAGNCGIVRLQKRESSADLFTRIYPWGAGVGAERISLASTTRSAPSGYTLDTANNYICNTSYETNYDRIERHVQYSQVSPRVANRLANAETAANMLFDLALYDLEQQIAMFENDIYDLTLVGCSRAFRPLDSLWIYYNDPVTGIQINQSMWVTAATISVNGDGIQTTQITVSGEPIRQRTEAEILLDNLKRVSFIQGVDQGEANGSFTIPFAGTVNSAGTAFIQNYIYFPNDIDGTASIEIYWRFTSTAGMSTKSHLRLGVQWDGGITGLRSLSLSTDLSNSWYYHLIDNAARDYANGVYVRLIIDAAIGAPAGSCTIEGFYRVAAKRK